MRRVTVPLKADPFIDAGTRDEWDVEHHMMTRGMVYFNAYLTAKDMFQLRELDPKCVFLPTDALAESLHYKEYGLRMREPTDVLMLEEIFRHKYPNATYRDRGIRYFVHTTHNSRIVFMLREAARWDTETNPNPTIEHHYDTMERSRTIAEINLDRYMHLAAK